MIAKSLKMKKVPKPDGIPNLVIIDVPDIYGLVMLKYLDDDLFLNRCKSYSL